MTERMTNVARLDLENLAQRFGTPFYLFDEGELLRRISWLRERLPSKVKLVYAVKANPFLVPALASAVERFEACSPGEARICLESGASPSSLVVSGVYKDEPSTARLMDEAPGTGRFTAESLAQFELIRRLAKERGIRVSVLLRLTSGSQFGFDGEQVAQVAQQFARDEWVDIAGIQFFSGTQKTSLKRYARELGRLEDFLDHLRSTCGFEARELEYGAGLPVEYFAPQDEQADGELVCELGRLIQDMRFQGDVAIELGRSIAASCGTYVTRIVDAKVNRGQRYAIADGGMHQIVYYGSSMAMKTPPCHVLRKGDAAEHADRSELWNVCGSLCTTNDVMVKQAPLGPLDVGDLLVFERAGAYCMTEGISLFLSRELPRVLAASATGEVRLLRDAVPTDAFNSPVPLTS